MREPKLANIVTVEGHQRLPIRTRRINIPPGLVYLARRRAAMVAAIIVVGYLLTAIIGPRVFPRDPFSGEASERLRPPSLDHPFGTDELGRDILTRIVYGAAVSFQIQLGTIAIGLIAGTGLGLASGYCRGWVDELIMRAMDVFLAFPSVFLAIAVIAAIGPGTLNLILAVGIALVPLFARLVRSCSMACREREYVEAARCIGAGHGRILARHILPNCSTPIIVYTTLNSAVVLLTASGLSYLGLGVQPPIPEWGAMLSNSRTYLLTAPHATVIPGMAIMLVSLALNMLGDGLRDALDPRLRLGP